MVRNVFDVLTERGFVEQVSDVDGVRSVVERPITCYVGFDPSAAQGDYVGLFAAGEQIRAWAVRNRDLSSRQQFEIPGLQIKGMRHDRAAAQHAMVIEHVRIAPATGEQVENHALAVEILSKVALHPRAGKAGRVGHACQQI